MPRLRANVDFHSAETNLDRLEEVIKNALGARGCEQVEAVVFCVGDH